MIYLDNNATTRPSPAVAHAAAEALQELWANPSSVHRAGQAVRHRVELARKSIAHLIDAAPRQIVFTSGGTEAIDLAIRSALAAPRNPQPPHPASAHPPAIVSTRTEHAAIRDLLDALHKSGAAEVRWAPVTASGLVDMASLAPFLPGAAACSIQWANNETGIIQPIAEIGRLCRGHGVLFHCDATQWVGKMPVQAPHDTFDYLTFAPHKFHGPKGLGVLWARRGAPLRPAIHGAQELGRRGGTENVPGILGAAIACDEARAWLADPAPREALAALRDRFEALVLQGVPDAAINSGSAPRLWNTSNIAFPRVEAEALLLMLSERGICASAGAACSSGSLEPSPVLLAMGIPPALAHGSIRFSLSRHTTEQEVLSAAAAVVDCVNRLRAALPITA